MFADDVQRIVGSHQINCDTWCFCYCSCSPSFHKYFLYSSAVDFFTLAFFHAYFPYVFFLLLQYSEDKECFEAVIIFNYII